MLNQIYKFINVVSLSIKNKYIFSANTLKIVFTKTNIIKLTTLFTVGFISRVFMSYVYSINPLYSYLSIFYTTCLFSLFMVLVPEFISYFMSEICNIITYILGFIIRIIISMNKRIFLYKLESIKIYPLIKGLKCFSFKDKDTIDMHISYTSENANTTKLLNSKKENSFLLAKNNESKPNERPVPGLGYETRREMAARIRRVETERIRKLAILRRVEAERIKQQRIDD